MGIQEKVQLYEGDIENSQYFEVTYPLQTFKINYKFEKKEVYLSETNEDKQSFEYKKVEKEAKREALDVLLKHAHKKAIWSKSKVLSKINYPYFNVLITHSSSSTNALYDIKIDLDVEGMLFKPINYSKALSKINVNQEINIKEVKFPYNKGEEN